MNNKIKQAISVNTGTPTTSIDLGSAISGFNALAQTTIDGEEITYIINQDNDYQICRGVYTASGPSLSVDYILEKSLSGIVTVDPATGITATTSDTVTIMAIGQGGIQHYQDSVLNSHYFMGHLQRAANSDFGPQVRTCPLLLGKSGK